MDRRKLAEGIGKKVTRSILESGLKEELEKLFYSGNKLLSMLDINRELPSLYFVCGNRTAGKTYYFKRWFVRRFLRYGEKFVVFVRYIDDIPGQAAAFWADIGPLEFKGKTMTQRSLMSGKAAELFIDDAPCGYVIAINSSNKVRSQSALFSDAVRGFFDEFMTETNEYVQGEIVKFNSLRISIARGGKSASHARYFPVYLCSNNVTVFNPYFTYFKIGERLTNRTKFLRGDGWVLEQTFNEAAAEAIKENFGNTMSEKELEYVTQNKYLLDTNKFVSKMSGNMFCYGVIAWESRMFGIWSTEFGDKLYVCRKFDPACRLRFAVLDADHDIDNVLINNGSRLVKNLRNYYNAGRVFFHDGACRSAFISAFGIK